MTNEQIAAALQALRPGAQWVIRDGAIEWTDDQQTKPTNREVQDWVDDHDYQAQRAPYYPPVQQLADAIFHKENGDDAPMTAYIAACQAVKDRYPKP